MISKQETVINQLMGTITKDKKEQGVIRINISGVAKILFNHGYNLPGDTFEKGVEEVLNKKAVGAAVTPGLMYSIAKVILEIADRLHITEKEMIAYLSTNNKEESPNDMREKIIQWRKEYYGAMDKGQKKELIEQLQNKLRPEVIYQIRDA